MNETDFIRQQLAAERAHLREILLAVRQERPAANVPRPINAYVEWALPRVLNQLEAHRAALLALPTLSAALRAQLTEVAAAAQVAEPVVAVPFNVRARRLLALLEAWSEPLDALAGATLRIGHWRGCAHLSADTIFEERQLHAAARAATALS
jgi:hypothetical protein